MIAGEIETINEMIQKTDDPGMKGVLLIILSMLNYERNSEMKIMDAISNIKVDHNRRITDVERNITRQDDIIETHIGILNRVKGAMWVVMGMSGVMSGVFIWSLTYISDLGKTVTMVETTQHEMAPKIDLLLKQTKIDPDIDNQIEDLTNQLKKLKNNAVNRASRP